jgi:hypothetical protein
VSIGLPSGGNRGETPAWEEELFMDCSPLLHVAFFSFLIDLDVLTNLVPCEASKTFQVAFVDCLYQRGNKWII